MRVNPTWWMYMLLVSALCKLVGIHATHSRTLNIPSFEWDLKDYPNPLDSTDICNHPQRESWICDPNGILNNEEALTLDNNLDDIRLTTLCTCDRCQGGNGERNGYVISFALLNKMQGIYHNPQSPTDREILKEAHIWTKYLRRRAWKFGDCGNDAVLLLSLQDKVIYMSTGEEVCTILSDRKIKEILVTSSWRFTDRDYFLGLRDITQTLEKTLRDGDKDETEPFVLGMTLEEVKYIGFILFGPLTILDLITIVFCAQVFCNVYVRGCKSHDVCYKVEFKKRRISEGFKLCCQPVGALLVVALVAAVNVGAFAGIVLLLRHETSLCGVNSGAGVRWT
ncbi:uncharacterized protein LOC100375696 [Saccoglossus kowalevskii]|uniref:Uncharacterized protein LOC100375696 n=1 Tax=Saccoglossus kowalevskii TaxID=10224 RepID=A0ABM0GZ30_SACKO|nr:PREDICTED: uncharacterized protein LOC100375696 [Saccoglossus kowalevskii]